MSPDEISKFIITSAMKVHTAIGPGMLESIYENCLAYELRIAGFKVEQQVAVPLKYGDMYLEAAFRLDLLVNSLVVVEIKSVETILPIHKAQIISYLKLSDKSLGLLINFNVPHLRHGIKRFVHGSKWKDPS